MKHLAVLLCLALAGCVTAPTKPAAFMPQPVAEMSCRALALSSTIIYAEVSRRNGNMKAEEVASYVMAAGSFILPPLAVVNWIAGAAGTSTADLWERYMLEDSAFKNRCVIFADEGNLT